jgi:hypothetical protein
MGYSVTTCHIEFEHSEINDVGRARYYLSLKPEVPPNAQCVCPNCGQSAAYKTTDLIYRAK